MSIKELAKGIMARVGGVVDAEIDAFDPVEAIISGNQGFRGVVPMPAVTPVVARQEDKDQGTGGPGL